MVLMLVSAACGGEKMPPIPDSVAISNTALAPSAGESGNPAADTSAGRPPAHVATPSERQGEFRAAGNEPFWNLVVTPQAMTIKTPQDSLGVDFVPDLPMVSGSTFHWKAETAVPYRHTIDVTIQEHGCQDTMADKKWTHTAIVILDGNTLSGCAERRGPGRRSTALDAETTRSKKRAELR